MKWVELILTVLIGLIIISTSGLAKEQPPVQSTEGFTLEQSVEKTVNPTKEDKASWKQKRKENRIYFKNKKAIKKQDYKRTKKLKEIEYLEKRVEFKKQQLETYNSNPEKGEKEE